MLALTCALLLSAAPTEPILASPGLNNIDVDPKKADFFADHFAAQLQIRGIRVTTRSEISALLGFERQKELVGCAEAKSQCLAELAGALGAQGIITGSLAKFRNGYTLNLKIIDATSGAPIALATGSAKDDADLVELLTSTAQKMAPEVLNKLEPRAPEHEPEPAAAQVAAKPDTTEAPAQTAAASASHAALRPGVLPLAIGGVALAGAGAFAIAHAAGISQELKNPGSSYWNEADPNGSVATAKSKAAEGQLFATLGYVGVGAGLAALAGAAVVQLLPRAPAVAVIATPNGAALSLVGRF